MLNDVFFIDSRIIFFLVVCVWYLHWSPTATIKKTATTKREPLEKYFW